MDRAMGSSVAVGSARPAQRPASSSGLGVQLKQAHAAGGFAAQEAALTPRAVQKKAPGAVQKQGIGSEIAEAVRYTAEVGPLGVLRGADAYDDNKDLSEAVKEANDALGKLKSGLEFVASQAKNQPKLAQELKNSASRIGQIQSGLGAIEKVHEAVKFLKEAKAEADRWSAAEASWQANMDNPTPENARRAARDMGTVVASVGSKLAQLPPPVGDWAGLLANAGPEFFEANVANIQHSLTNAELVGRCAVDSSAPECDKGH